MGKVYGDRAAFKTQAELEAEPQANQPVPTPVAPTSSLIPAVTSAATTAGINAALNTAAPSAPVIVEAGGQAVPTAVPATGSVAGPIAAIPLAVNTGIQSWEGGNKFLQGKPLSFQEQAALALPTFGASFLSGPIQSLLGLGRDADTTQRMGVKKNLDTRYGFGPNLEFQNPQGQTMSLAHSEYNVDFNNPLSQQAVGYANPFAHYIASQQSSDPKQQQKIASDLAGEIANTIMGGAQNPIDLKNNILGFAQKLGVQPGDLRTTIEQMFKNKQLDMGTRDAFFAAISNLTGGKGAQDLSVKPASPAPTSDSGVYGKPR